MPAGHGRLLLASAAADRRGEGTDAEPSGLTEALRSGLSVPVTFEFRDAGSLTLSVPINSYTDVRPDRFVEHSCDC
jgi:hypothetical protein